MCTTWDAWLQDLCGTSLVVTPLPLSLGSFVSLSPLGCLFWGLPCLSWSFFSSFFLPSFPFFLLRSVAFLASPPCRFSTAGGYGGVPWFRSGFCLSCCLPLCIRYTTSNDTLVVRGRGMALARSLSRFSLGSAAAPPWRVSGRISPLLCMAPKASALCGEASLYTM